jgi:hypothetical protein
MGMFDNLKCSYPLPTNIDLKEETFQTKHTPAQWSDLYEIREDGTLWHELYDIEDHSDPTKEGFARFFGCMTKVNKRWLPVTDFIGEIRFYTTLDNDTKLIEFSAYFVDGKMKELHSLGEKELPKREEQEL